MAKCQQKKNELIAKYHEWNGRPVPIFDIIQINEASIDDNNDDFNDYEVDVL